MTGSSTIEEFCQRARQYLKSGEPRDALRCFEEARQLNDLDPDVHEGLAATYVFLKDLEQAIQHYERVTRLDPRRGAAWSNLGALYIRLNNHQRAVEVLRRAVQIDRKSSDGFFNLGLAYKQLKQWALATSAFREALRIAPKLADAYRHLGDVSVEMGNLPLAISQYKKGLELNPELKRGRQGLEEAERRLAEGRQAVSPFGRLVDSAPSEPSAAPADGQGRELTEEERVEDRRALHALLEQAHDDLEELTHCLRDQLEPAVKTLNRLLTHRASVHGEPLTKPEAFEQFLEARTAFSPRVHQFRRVLQQMRDHEAKFQ